MTGMERLFPVSVSPTTGRAAWTLPARTLRLPLATLPQAIDLGPQQVPLLLVEHRAHGSPGLQHVVDQWDRVNGW